MNEIIVRQVDGEVLNREYEVLSVTFFAPKINAIPRVCKFVEIDGKSEKTLSEILSDVQAAMTKGNQQIFDCRADKNKRIRGHK